MPRTPKPAVAPQRPQRTDLLNPTPQPISAVPGQGYGMAGQQLAAQRVAPMAGGGTAVQRPSGPPLGAVATIVPLRGGQGSATSPQMGDLALQQHAMQSGAGIRGAFSRPTERPNEPVTHGLPVGPGGGPEVLQGVGALARENAIQQGTITHLLQNLANQPNATSAVKALATTALSGAL